MAVRTRTPPDIQTAEEFRRRLRRLYGREARELLKYLGDPPDVRNVPEHVWRKIREDQRAAYMLLMLWYGGIWLDDWLNQIEAMDPRAKLDRDQVARRFRDHADTRSRYAADKVVRTTRDRLDAAFRRRSDDESSETAATVLHGVYGDGRVDTVLRTEATAAQTTAMRTVFDSASQHAPGLWHQVWRLRPCRHCTVCPLLDGTTSEVWGQFFAGPPAHPNCCCELEIVHGEREDLLRAGVIREGDRAAIRAEVRRTGMA